MRNNAPKRVEDPHHSFTKLFQQNCDRHRPHTVFSDFCEMAALSISNAVDLAQYDGREARYLQIAGTYSSEELSRFAQMLACVTEALDGRMHDCLGQLFMSLEMGNHWKGQYFTPYELAGLMARMTLHGAAETLQERGFVTISEPAAGAGGMVIAVAEALREQGFNFQRCMHVTAVDVDPTAAHMCYLQLSLLHIPAIVVVGNSLTLDERSHWYTPAHIVDGWGHRLRSQQAIAEVQELLMPASQWSPAAPAEPTPAVPTDPQPSASMVQTDLF